jgi:hypothetical protein
MVAVASVYPQLIFLIPHCGHHHQYDPFVLSIEILHHSPMAFALLMKTLISCGRRPHHGVALNFLLLPNDHHRVNAVVWYHARPLEVEENVWLFYD